MLGFMLIIFGVAVPHATSAFSVRGFVTTVDTPTQETQESCGYESCHRVMPGSLNVHIVPHTHDDVGWLKTVDQYFYGSRNNIQKAGVQYILDSVVKELWEDRDRRFIYVETAFFWKWWVRQTEVTKAKVKTLVDEGRLQFVGGAWTMNDEAAAHYQSIIDQFTWGLSKLNKTFGYCGMPRVGWQIDPFGHSREFASLLAMMGYDGLFLGRLDYQDKLNRLKTKTMEMVWRGDDDLGHASDIFTGALHNNYSPPPGFCFDVLCNDEPIIDDPQSPINNVENKVMTFLGLMSNYSKSYRTNNILITMGEDFNYQDAGMWYKNLDKLIEYTNLIAARQKLNVQAFYSTPNCYLKAIKDANPKLPRKIDDFFPYASDPTAFWTGYFTSRPTTKYFEREANRHLQMLKQLQVFANLNENNLFVLNELKSAMGVMQHHDAITGTEKQHVADDYVRMLNQALNDASIIAKQGLNKLFDSERKGTYEFQRCQLNESRCDVSESSDQFLATVYNPLGWSVAEPIRIPVPGGNYNVFSPSGKPIEIQQIPISTNVKEIPSRTSIAVQEIVFIANLYPLSYKTYLVKKIPARSKRSSNYYSRNQEYYDALEKINEYQRKTDKRDESYLSVEGLDNQIPYPLIDDVRNPIPVLRDHDMYKDSLHSDLITFKDYIKGRDENRHKNGEIRKMSPDEMRMLADEPRVESDRFEDIVDFENEFIRINLDRTQGKTNYVLFPDEGRLNLSISMHYYPAYAGNNVSPEARASGAYIFRPNATRPVPLTIAKTQTVTGAIVKEFQIQLEPSGYLNIKLYTSLNFIDVEFIVGPIPINEGIGKEYIIKYETDIINNGDFYTDSNGRQMLKRKLNFRPQWNVTLAEPIAGNYYPVTNQIFIKNKYNKMAVLTDRSEGGSSLEEGQIELMVHRRLLYDDAFGVGEPLNETKFGVGLVVRGNHRLILNGADDSNKKQVFGVHMSPIVLFSEAENLKLSDFVKLNTTNSFLYKELPKGLHLLTFEPFEGKLLIRFENYLLAENDLNAITLDISRIFRNILIRSVKDAMLGANVLIDDYKQFGWNTLNYNSRNNVIIVVKPKEIKTYIAEYEIIRR